jgi:hypothetical protein
MLLLALTDIRLAEEGIRRRLRSLLLGEGRIRTHLSLGRRN